MNSDISKGSYRQVFSDCLILCLFMPGFMLGAYLSLSFPGVEFSAYCNGAALRDGFWFRLFLFCIPEVMVIFGRFNLLLRVFCILFAFLKSIECGFAFCTIYMFCGFGTALRCVFIDFVCTMLMYLVLGHSCRFPCVGSGAAVGSYLFRNRIILLLDVLTVLFTALFLYAFRQSSF